MKIKLAVLLALLGAIGGSAFAQTIVPIVGGVVTADVGRNNTFKVIVNANVTSVVLTSGQTPAGGQIITIFFTENATGGFTVAFGGNISNACSVTTTANTTTACQFQFNGTDGTWYGTSGGSSSSGAAGAISDASIYISSTCGTATNCFAATPGNVFFDCTYASASPTLTCTANDNLTPFATGTWRVVVTCCGSQGGVGHIASALEAPAVTTVSSVNNVAHTITMNQNATNTRNSVQGQAITLVQDQTTIFQNSSNAALNSGGHCAPLQIGAGVYGVRQGFANAATCKNSITSTNTTGWGVTGAGPGGRSGTTIVPLPDFDFSTCTGQGSSCFFGIQGAIISNLAIWGGDNSTSANSSTCGANAKSIIDLNTDSIANNILLAGWCASDTALRGVKFDTPGEYCIYCIIDGAGGVSAEIVAGSASYIINSFLGDSNGVTSGADGVASLIIGSGAIMQSIGTGYGIGGNNKTLIQNNSGTLYSQSDRCLLNSANNNGCYLGRGTSVAHINQLFNFGNGNTNDLILNVADVGSFAHVRNSVFTPGATGNGLNCGAGALGYFDEGGNTFVRTNCTASQLFGSASITGTKLIATNVTASTGWGTTGAAGNGISAPLGDSHLFTFTVTATGTPTASPTLAVTFPTPYFVAPQCLLAQQIGGTGVVQALTTTTGPSATAVTFTWNGTPVAGSTYIIQGSCQ